MDIVNSSKYTFVINWLESKYKNKSSIPPFEVNEQNINVLYQLACFNERRNNEVIQINQINQQILEQYKQEKHRYHTILEESGIRQKIDENETIGSAINCLVDVATELNLKNTDINNFYFGIFDLQSQQSQLDMALQDEKDKQNHLKKQTQHVLNALAHLQKVLSDAKSAKVAKTQTMKQQLENMQYLKTKANEYQNQLADLKTLFTESGMSESLSHSSIIELHKRIEETKRQSAPKLATLSAYNQLPPDLALATIQIEAARQKLQQLEEQFTETVQRMI